MEAGTSQQETNGRRDREFRERRALCAPLLQAALKGHWQAGEAFLKKNPHCIAFPITTEQGTALHHAAAAKRTNFVNELIKLMSPWDLELQTTSGYMALHLAAQSGSVTIAREMVEKTNKLLCIRMNNRMTPLGFAASLGPRHKNMVQYLFSVTWPYQNLTTTDRINLLLGTISSDIHSIENSGNQSRVTTCRQDSNSLGSIENVGQETFGNWQQKSAINLGKMLKRLFCNKALMQTLAHQVVENLWRESAILANEQFLTNMAMADSRIMDLLAEAAKVGNVEFLVILLRSCPDLIWKGNEEYSSLFHITISCRRESVLALIYEIGSVKDIIARYHDENKNNMLHLAGHLAPSERLDIVPGAALQMQRELLWFKEIEKIVQPSFAKKENSDNLTPADLFR
ncbi:hypothetical protein CJ030_MR1G014979 [Morella rubra]|uniref:Uncharacterized protein n=1 Tax=Morella rubra TaxID=262757 RepID=A0A6A1WNZ3_9ROSI|nr:hypothetical protein CJ030_MR1G014979 [Morella rubra]